MIVNGKEMTFQTEITVEELLKELNFGNTLVVVEVDIEIIPSDEYSTKRLNELSKVEIIKFVGGG